jgi:acyl-CoA dehydrogenase
VNRVGPVLQPFAPADVTRQLRARCERFIVDEVNPGSAERDQRGEPLPAALLLRAGELGLCSYLLQQSLGGEGRSWLDWGRVLYELAYLSTDAALPIFAVQAALAGQVLAMSARPPLLDRYLHRVMRGEGVLPIAWSEGTDAFSFKTKAYPVDGGWVVSGQKQPLAAGAMALGFIVFARTESTNDVVALVVDRQAAGVEVEPVVGSGLRTAGFVRLKLTDVHVPSLSALASSDGLSYGQQLLSIVRLQLPCWVLGRMRALFDRCVGEVNRRVRLGLPVSEMQAVQATLGRMAIAVESTRLMVTATLERASASQSDPFWDPGVVMTKVFAVEQALVLCRGVQDLIGGAAIFDETFSRDLRDLPSFIANLGTQLTLQVDLGVLAAEQHRQANPTPRRSFS